MTQISFQMEKKSNVGTNKYGQPNSGDENCRALITSIGIMSITHIPIIYQDFREVPNSLIERIAKNLEVIIHASIKTYLQFYFIILIFIFLFYNHFVGII